MYNTMTTEEQDNVIGRHISDNEEFDEAPESAHVKRAAQESFEPEAFVLRRSMPWADGMNAGLVFVAFGKSFDAFEAILNRMLGNEDSISDALFTFTRPISGAYYWCPPVKAGKLDLSVLGL
jgi:putative iron-dependent peroxidase